MREFMTLGRKCIESQVSVRVRISMFWSDISSCMSVDLSWMVLIEIAERTLKWGQMRDEKITGLGLISISPERRRKQKRKLVDLGGKEYKQDFTLTVKLIKWDNEIVSRDWQTDEWGIGGNRKLGDENAGGWEEQSSWNTYMRMNRMNINITRTGKKWKRVSAEILLGKINLNRDCLVGLAEQ